MVPRDGIEPPDQADELIDNEEDYDTPLKERFGVNLETFGKIADALHPGQTHERFLIS